MIRRVSLECDTTSAAARDASSASPTRRLVCEWCRASTERARADAKYCGKRCRQAAWRFRGDLSGVAASSQRPMSFAYADPPYPGMAARYYADHPDYAGEVDHQALVARLCAEFPDGWALSTSSRALRDVLMLCPPDVWIGVWTKPVPPGYTVRPRSAWEPVIFRGGRVLPRAQTTVLDWVHAAPMRSYPGAVVGTKPPAFCAWLFASLGACRDDTLADLFPGSGAVGRAFELSRAAGGDASPASASATDRGRAPALADSAAGLPSEEPHLGGLPDELEVAGAERAQTNQSKSHPAELIGLGDARDASHATTAHTETPGRALAHFPTETVCEPLARSERAVLA